MYLVKGTKTRSGLLDNCELPTVPGPGQEKVEAKRKPVLQLKSHQFNIFLQTPISHLQFYEQHFKLFLQNKKNNTPKKIGNVISA